MALKEQLKRLAKEKDNPCVTISLNTHRTHPDNTHDVVLLKNLLKEAEERVIAEYEKRSVVSLLEKIGSVSKQIDVNYNLDSLHIFLSNKTQEVVRMSMETSNGGVHISDHFALRTLIDNYVHSQHYFIMLLSQSGVKLFEAVNADVIDEVKNDDFPFSENRHYNTNAAKSSDSKHLDDLVREFLNKVDKALVKVHNETGLQCVVIATEDNFSRLQQVADKPGVYLGYVNIDYNNTATHHIAKQSWELIKVEQRKLRTDAIGEMKESVAHGLVLTDLQEIYQAAIDGRGDLLIIHKGFSQPVVMTSERTFDLVKDRATPNAIDDITSSIAWEVLYRNGRVFFTQQDEIKELGEIVLKTRY